MVRAVKITIVDDKPNDGQFYPELIGRLRQDLLPEPEISWIGAIQLMPDGKSPILAELRNTVPDVILMDLVLDESIANPGDLSLAGLLTSEIKREPSLKTVPLIYVSNFFGVHYAIPDSWRCFCFAKGALVSDEQAWNLFRRAIENPTLVAAQQLKLKSLPRMLSLRPSDRSFGGA
jgi:hypothetical protein